MLQLNGFDTIFFLYLQFLIALYKYTCKVAEIIFCWLVTRAIRVLNKKKKIVIINEKKKKIPRTN